MANQDKNTALKAEFKIIAESLIKNEENIISELNDNQGATVNIGGYYQPNNALADAAMRPNSTLNSILV